MNHDVLIAWLIVLGICLLCAASIWQAIRSDRSEAWGHHVATLPIDRTDTTGDVA